MKQFLIKLRKILQYKSLYLIILILVWFGISAEVKSIYKEEYISEICKILYYKIDGDKLTIDLNCKEKLRGYYYFDSLEEKTQFNSTFSSGDKITVSGKLTSPKNNTIPNTFNYRNYLKSKKIYKLINIDKINLLKKSNNIFDIIKRYIYLRLEKIDNEYLYAFIVGESSGIDNEVYDMYKVNGILHLFALSGMHVSLLSAIIGKFFKNKYIKYVIVTCFLFFQAFIASFTASIVRAVLFFVIKGLFDLFNEKIDGVSVCLLTLIIMLIINPFYVYSTGFVLSFVVTYFISLFSKYNRYNSKVASTLFISIISFLSAFIIIVNNYYEINIISFINNIFFIPFVSFFVYPLSLLSFVFPFLSKILDIFISVMESISVFCTEHINITMIFDKVSIIEIVIFYILLLVIIYYKKFYLYIIMSLYILFLSVSFNDGSFKIYFLDVGQGDSTLITYKDKSILIDTGGTVKYDKELWKHRNNEFNLMESSIIPFFKSTGLSKIDCLILTHGDYDHMGEAINLVENFKVEKVIFNNDEYNVLELELIKILKEKNIPYYQNIKELNIDEVKLYFLNNKLYDNENDNSNVVFAEFEGIKLLLMGDAGVEVERDLLEKYNLSDIDILKVGHHGSKTSSSERFIDNINPEYSIISVGKNNRYAHPNQEVLENLTNTKIYRTDQAGSIMFKIKNNKLKIEICVP